eukprot:1177781-Pyramimonas_sp.AAC.1
MGTGGHSVPDPRITLSRWAQVGHRVPDPLESADGRRGEAESQSPRSGNGREGEEEEEERTGP